MPFACDGPGAVLGSSLPCLRRYQPPPRMMIRTIIQTIDEVLIYRQYTSAVYSTHVEDSSQKRRLVRGVLRQGEQEIRAAGAREIPQERCENAADRVLEPLVAHVIPAQSARMVQALCREDLRHAEQSRVGDRPRGAPLYGALLRRRLERGRRRARARIHSRRAGL